MDLLKLQTIQFHPTRSPPLPNRIPLFSFRLPLRLNHRKRRIQFIQPNLAAAAADRITILDQPQSIAAMIDRIGGEEPLELRILEIGGIGFFGGDLVVELGSGDSGDLVAPLDLAGAADSRGEGVVKQAGKVALKEKKKEKEKKNGSG